jgi:exodeoxyribonuclease III
LKIYTYNVNGISARLPNFLRWLQESAPDVACLQELKATQENFPEAAIRDAGYGVVWHGQKSWNGVAILARGAEPVEITRALPGDYNVIPTEHDVYKPERWVDDALFRVEVREAYATLLRQGWTDALRTLHPHETIYTYWDFFRNAYGRNAGLRIDHLLLNPALAGRLSAAGVERGWEKPSDHAPTWIELR